MASENEILQAAKQICEEKNISLDSVIETIEAALAVAYRKDFGEKNENVKVEFDIKTGGARIFDIKTVVSDEKAALTEQLKEEKRAQEELEGEEKEAADKLKKEKSDTDSNTSSKAKSTNNDTAEGNEDDKIERFNPKTEITVTDAQEIKKGAQEGDVLKTEFFPPAAYGRMAAQTAKQVIIQRLREAERENIFKEFKDREGSIINGTVQRIEGKVVLIDLGQTTAILPSSEQIPRERYTPGQRYKFYVVAVNQTSKGPEIIMSRSHTEMVKKLFLVEVPEIGNGSVEIKSIAREAGSRTKIAVLTTQRNIDPVGSCVGQRGSRVQTIISEIGGEKIDIIEWDEDSVKFITNALSPAKVLSVQLNEEERTALVEVKEDQLSLAIGKGGQNVRLSAKLTGWKIDIVSDMGEKVVADKDSEVKEDGEDETQEADKESDVDTNEADEKMVDEGEEKLSSDTTTNGKEDKPAEEQKQPVQEKKEEEPVKEGSDEVKEADTKKD